MPAPYAAGARGAKCFQYNNVSHCVRGGEKFRTVSESHTICTMRPGVKRHFLRSCRPFCAFINVSSAEISKYLFELA